MSDTYENMRKMVQDTVGTVAAPIQTGVPALGTTFGSSRLLKTAREKKGYTSTGGRRSRKSKKSRKTRRRHRK